MVESDDVVRAAFEALLSWPGYQVLARVLNETPELRMYLAGGVIRDVLLGRKGAPKDFDFFLAGRSAQQALTTLESHGSMQIGPFGSPRWFPGDDKERYCDLIQIKEFYNGLWRREDIVDALNQFDFTGNAVAMDLRNGEFYNPQNGRRDMERRVMRIVRFDYPDEPIGPAQSLSRPTVLWFRILRYAATLDLTIEPITRQWLIHHRSYWKQADTFASTVFPVRRSLEDVLGEEIDD